MAGKILITYASRSGATSGIAKAIGKRVAEDGFRTEVLSLAKVKNLSEYEVAVIGSSIQGREWLPEALEFVRLNQEQLNRMKTAIFTVCITLAMKNGEKYLPEIRKWILPVREMMHPQREAFFAGVLDIKKIASLGDRLKFRLSVFFGVWKEGDHRDWMAIRNWAGELGSMT